VYLYYLVVNCKGHLLGTSNPKCKTSSFGWTRTTVICFSLPDYQTRELNSDYVNSRLKLGVGIIIGLLENVSALILLSY